MGSGHRTIREVGPAALLELADHRVSLRLAVVAREAVHEGAEAPESSRRCKDLVLMRITLSRPGSRNVGGAAHWKEEREARLIRPGSRAPAVAE
jgi:hypothetical protein